MSELLVSVQAHTTPELEKLADGLADDFLSGMKDILSSADDAAKDKVQAILKQGAKFKFKALTAEDPEQAREYAEAVETSVRRVKTILLAEQIVAEETIAALVSNLWSKALDGLATIAKGLLTTVVTGIVQGAIKGLTGGGGSEGLSDIFPFG